MFETSKKNWSEEHKKQKVLPEMLEHCPMTIDELKEVRAQIQSRGEFKGLTTEERFKQVKDTDSKAHLLMKQNIFYSIPEEFYQKNQKEFFDEMLTTNQRKDVNLMHKRAESTSRRVAATQMMTHENTNTGGVSLGVPSSRSDSIALQKWLNSMLDVLSADVNLPEEEKFDLAQTVYYICFREVIRQVSVHCIERGLLIWSMWRAYISLMESLGIGYQNKLNQAITDYQNKIKQVIDEYTRKESSIQEEASKARAKIAETENINHVLTSKLNSIEKENAAEREKLNSDLLNLKIELQKYEELKEKHNADKGLANSLKKEIHKLREKCEEQQNLIQKYNKNRLRAKPPESI